MIVLRLIWVFIARYALVRPGPDPVTGQPPPWQFTFLLGWAGMRGVVTLAAAFLIPDDTAHREVLLIVAFTVVAGTLFIQGLSLPTLARMLKVPPPDPLDDALARATLLQQASKAGFDELEKLEYDDPAGIVDLVRQRVDQRNFAAWERLSTAPGQESPAALYYRIRMAMIEAERRRILEIRKSGTIASEVIADVLAMLDVEESMLDSAEQERDESRRTPPVAGRRATLCADLRPLPGQRGGAGDVLPGLRRRRHPVGLAAPLSRVRQRRLLRLVTPGSTPPALPRDPPPGHAVRRAGGGLALVLRPPPHRPSR